MSATQDIILTKKAALADSIREPLGRLAEQCAKVWPLAEKLDALLQAAIPEIPECNLLYAWDVDAIEISSMITATSIDPSWRGRNLSDRPYLTSNLPFKGIMLSSVYKSMYSNKQCITALQAVSREDKLLGFIAADFELASLIANTELSSPEAHWQQFRGDPAVRGTVFMQERATSLLDEHIDEVNDQISNLIIEHGIFHVKIHYSSGRVSFWLYDDPYDYRIHHISEIIDPDICFAYPVRPYPERATITPEQVRAVLDEFKGLRFADETIYLRSSSLNIINGMLGLTFSCDGSHYMPVDEFLEKNLGFWLGNLSSEDKAADDGEAAA